MEHLKFRIFFADIWTQFGIRYFWILCLFQNVVIKIPCIWSGHNYHHKRNDCSKRCTWLVWILQRSWKKVSIMKFKKFVKIIIWDLIDKVRCLRDKVWNLKDFIELKNWLAKECLPGSTSGNVVKSHTYSCTKPILVKFF